MKKSILFMVAVLGLLTACDPSKDDLSMPTSSLTADRLSGGFATTQYSDEECTTQAADGNYFTFTTSPARVVSIYQLDDEGSKNVLVSGLSSGKFKIVPKRGKPYGADLLCGDPQLRRVDGSGREDGQRVRAL